jgi:tetratricopeptide (TPR) repeat protein
MKRCMARVALFATLVASTAAFAAPKAGEARVQFDRGVAAYTKGDYAAAAEALGASFVLEADPETLFAWAQTERKLGHCDRAIDLYGKLLGMDLPAENKQAIRVQISECKAITADKATKPADKATKPADKATKPADKAIGTKPVDKPVEAPPVETPVPTPPLEQQPIDSAQLDTTPPREEPRPITNEGRAWWKDPVGGALVGAGAISIGVGIVFLVQASAADADKSDALLYPEFESLADRAESRGRLGVIGLGAGGALATAGVVWYVTHKPSSERAVTTLVLPSGAGVAFSGRF